MAEMTREVHDQYVVKTLMKVPQSQTNVLDVSSTSAAAFQLPS